jgi:hypothetical protein
MAAGGWRRLRSFPLTKCAGHDRRPAAAHHSGAKAGASAPLRRSGRKNNRRFLRRGLRPLAISGCREPFRRSTGIRALICHRRTRRRPQWTPFGVRPQSARWCCAATPGSRPPRSIFRAPTDSGTLSSTLGLLSSLWMTEVLAPALWRYGWRYDWQFPRKAVGSFHLTSCFLEPVGGLEPPTY